MICCLPTNLVRSSLITFEPTSSFQLHLTQKQKAAGYEIPPSFMRRNSSVKKRPLPSNYYCNWKAAAWAQRLVVMFSLLAASTCLPQKRPHPLASHPAGSWEAGGSSCGHWGKGRLMMGREPTLWTPGKDEEWDLDPKKPGIPFWHFLTTQLDPYLGMTWVKSNTSKLNRLKWARHLKWIPTVISTTAAI